MGDIEALATSDVPKQSEVKDEMTGNEIPIGWKVVTLTIVIPKIMGLGDVVFTPVGNSQNLVISNGSEDDLDSTAAAIIYDTTG